MLGVTKDIELVAVEELVKLKSVFDVIGHWAVDLLTKTVRNLDEMVNGKEGGSDPKQTVLNHARVLTGLLGMLTSQCHLGKFLERLVSF